MWDLIQDSRITPKAKGRCSTTEPLRHPWSPILNPKPVPSVVFPIPVDFNLVRLKALETFWLLLFLHTLHFIGLRPKHIQNLTTSRYLYCYHCSPNHHHFFPGYCKSFRPLPVYPQLADSPDILVRSCPLTAYSGAMVLHFSPQMPKSIEAYTISFHYFWPSLLLLFPSLTLSRHIWLPCWSSYCSGTLQPWGRSLADVYLHYSFQTLVLPTPSPKVFALISTLSMEPTLTILFHIAMCPYSHSLIPLTLFFYFSIVHIIVLHTIHCS